MFKKDSSQTLGRQSSDEKDEVYFICMKCICLLPASRLAVSFLHTAEVEIYCTNLATLSDIYLSITVDVVVTLFPKPNNNFIISGRNYILAC